jgi:hypothetical protein
MDAVDPFTAFGFGLDFVNLIYSGVIRPREFRFVRRSNIITRIHGCG